MPALLTSSHDLRANCGNHDDDVDPCFGIRGQSVFDARDNKPISANFRGTEWGDDIDQEEIPLSARVVITRPAKMPWGAIFKLEFTDLKSRAEKRREIRPDCFIVTDNRIVLLNEEDNDAAAKKISALSKPPDFEVNDIYGITSGSFEHQEGEWKRQSN